MHRRAQAWLWAARRSSTDTPCQVDGERVAVTEGNGLRSLGVLPSGFSVRPGHRLPSCDWKHNRNPLDGLILNGRERASNVEGVVMHLFIKSVVLLMLPLTVGCGGDPLEPGPEPPPGDLNTTLRLDTVATGLSSPIELISPVGDARLFVAEQTGAVRIIAGGQMLATPFVDVTNDVRCCGEQGLLGIAFHPDHADNGFFYVSYTDDAGDSRIDRFTVSGDPDVIDVATRLNIMTVSQPFSNHNGGKIDFGDDGMFYFALGDGGSGDDPLNSGQNTTTLLGSLLRIDVNAAEPYAIPSGNPFAGSATNREEIWAHGLRNPWRFSFDRVAGNVYIGDVGQGAYEEVNVVEVDAVGINYGWNIMEGMHCRPGGGANCDRTGLTLPVLEYENGSGGCAVIGGYVYRGTAIPEIVGHYFYSDNCGGWLRSFRYESGSVSQETEWSVAPFGRPRSFGVDAEGELYILSGSNVLRIVPAS